MNENKNYTGGAFKMHGNWQAQSDLLKLHFSSLTDHDLEFEDDGEKKLLRKLETRLNKSREEVIEIIKRVQPENKKIS